MKKMPDSTFSIRADAANPGQFFACCGLLELSHRLWPGAEGYFADDAFKVVTACGESGLPKLVSSLRVARLDSDDEAGDEKTCPLLLRASSPERQISLRLDWWRDGGRPGGSLKTWAGQQRVTAISRAMLDTAASLDPIDTGWFNHGTVACAPGSGKPVEPFYFDARRYAHALDAGFSLDAVDSETISYPSVEIMALIGLQRFHPRPVEENIREFEYFTWNRPLGAIAAAAVACGAVPVAGGRGFRFSLRFRDDQKRYKAFGFASLTGGKR